MIKDKITTDLKSRFKEEILNSRNDGIERAFFLCLNKKLHASKTCLGSRCNVTLNRPKDACPGKVQGDFHTHPALNFIKETLKERNVKIPPDTKIIDTIIGDLKSKGFTPQAPSHEDLLFGLNMQYFGDSNGTTCVGVDYDDTKVECWTPKHVPHEAYIKANDELVKKEKGLEDLPKKWIRSLYEKEIIYLEDL